MSFKSRVRRTNWVDGGRPLRGRIRVPGDKSISHRVLILAALAGGESSLTGLSDGDDVMRTVVAIRSLGAKIHGEPGNLNKVLVQGGRDRLRLPQTEIDLGNSGTAMRLLAGVVSGMPGRSVLAGDESLSSRPMDRIAVPLRLMGATVEGEGERCTPPLTIDGAQLVGIDYTCPVSSAQVKSAVLLAGLGAEGDTVIHEDVLTRIHMEEILAFVGAKISWVRHDNSQVVRLTPTELEPFTLDVPGDPSQAAFWLVAACIVPDSEVCIRHVYVGPGRRGFLDVLGRMGADLEGLLEEVEPEDPDLPEVNPEDDPEKSYVMDLVARSGPLEGVTVRADEIPGLVDEIPILAVAAAVAEGDTIFRGVGKLRVKESDRLAGIVALLGAFGATAEIAGEDLIVRGGARLVAGQVDSGGDHRMAMAAIVAGSAARASSGTTRVDGWEAVDTSYPGFYGDLRKLLGGAEPAGEQPIERAPIDVAPPVMSDASVAPPETEDQGAPDEVGLSDLGPDTEAEVAVETKAEAEIFTEHPVDEIGSVELGDFEVEIISPEADLEPGEPEPTPPEAEPVEALLPDLSTAPEPQSAPAIETEPGIAGSQPEVVEDALLEEIEAEIAELADFLEPGDGQPDAESDLAEPASVPATSLSSSDRSPNGSSDAVRPTEPAALRVIAIDGPAGAGKSTLARALAERLGMHRLDTGAMYRAVTWSALQREIDPADADGVATVARSIRIELEDNTVLVDRVDVSEAIRSPEVNAAVSTVAAIPAVRVAMVSLQRAWVEDHAGGVVEGRDIGSVVCPNAILKIYLTASEDARSSRRPEEDAGSMAHRDLKDSTRSTAPLTRTKGSVLMDTTERSVNEIVEEVVGWL